MCSSTHGIRRSNREVRRGRNGIWKKKQNKSRTKTHYSVQCITLFNYRYFWITLKSFNACIQLQHAQSKASSDELTRREAAERHAQQLLEEVDSSLHTMGAVCYGLPNIRAFCSSLHSSVWHGNNLTKSKPNQRKLKRTPTKWPLRTRSTIRRLFERNLN